MKIYKEKVVLIIKYKVLIENNIYKVLKSFFYYVKIVFKIYMER